MVQIEKRALYLFVPTLRVRGSRVDLVCSEGDVLRDCSSRGPRTQIWDTERGHLREGIDMTQGLSPDKLQ